MPKGIYAAASAMVTESKALDVTAANLANASTVGYRKHVALREGFAESLAREGRTGPISGDGGSGVRHDTAFVSFAEGQHETTGNPLDVALRGAGAFFRVRDQDGKVLLTRSGHFVADNAGRLVTDAGFPVEGQGGAITIPPEASRVVIDQAGRVFMQNPGTGATQTLIDQLRVVTVPEPGKMRPHGGQYFDPGEQTQNDATGHSIEQGYLERSNVDSIAELVQLISINRRFEASQRALRQQEAAGRDFSELLRG